MTKHKEKRIELKVSGTGWLCVKMPDGSWLPAVELTPQQVQDYNECVLVQLHAFKEE